MEAICIIELVKTLWAEHSLWGYEDVKKIFIVYWKEVGKAGGGGESTHVKSGEI